jgi:hypothetical protein
VLPIPPRLFCRELPEVEQEASYLAESARMATLSLVFMGCPVDGSFHDSSHGAWIIILYKNIAVKRIMVVDVLLLSGQYNGNLTVRKPYYVAKHSHHDKQGAGNGTTGGA